jgi:transcription elongation factor SPT6
MAVCWGPGRPATTVVVLDERGELIDSLYAGFLGSKGIGGPQAHERWEEDKRKLEKFIKEHQPHMAVIGAANLRCKNLFDDVNQVGALDDIFVQIRP